MHPKAGTRPSSRLARISLIAAPVAWALIFASGRVTGTTFDEEASNRMLLLLSAAAAIALGGTVLGVLALRARRQNRLLATLGLAINAINAALLLVLGLLWLGMSI